MRRTPDDVPGRKVGCRPTTHALNKDNYGACAVRRHGVKVNGAHRLAWVDANGRLPKPGMVICHHCDWPPCINPEHLYEGTPRDNAIDRETRNKATACRNGHPFEPGSFYLEWYSAGYSARKCLICQEERGTATPARRLKALVATIEQVAMTG